MLPSRTEAIDLLVCVCGKDLRYADVSPKIGQYEMSLRHAADPRLPPCKPSNCPCGIPFIVDLSPDLDWQMCLLIERTWLKMKSQSVRNGKVRRAMGAARLIYEANHIWYRHTTRAGFPQDPDGPFAFVLP